MRNKRLTAGSHLLPPHVMGAWSYGFYSHYPRGPYPSRHNASCSGGEWMSCSSSLNLPAPQMCFKIFRRSLSPLGLSLVPNNVAHSDFGRCQSSSPSTTPVHNWRLRRKTWGLQKFGQHGASFIRSQNRGESTPC